MKSVLVVDDNLLNANLAKIILTRAGFAVTTVSSALDALASIENAMPDVVVTDISMPVTSGKDLCVALRSKHSASSLRIVAYTALAMEEERKAIMAAGFDDLVVKPASRETLVAAVTGLSLQAESIDAPGAGRRS